MSFFLNFAKDVDRNGKRVAYPEDALVGPPVRVSVPAIVALVRRFTEGFDRVAIVEAPRARKAGSDRARLQRVSDIDKVTLDRLAVDLAEFVAACGERLAKPGANKNSHKSRSRSLTSGTTPIFSGLVEAAEVRNFVMRYVKGRNPLFRKGYLFIVES